MNASNASEPFRSDELHIESRDSVLVEFDDEVADRTVRKLTPEEVRQRLSRPLRRPVPPKEDAV